MKKRDLRDIIELVKSKLSGDAETACGLFWADVDPPIFDCYGVAEPPDDSQ